jgi:hypothetical protein
MRAVLLRTPRRCTEKLDKVDSRSTAQPDALEEPFARLIALLRASECEEKAVGCFGRDDNFYLYGLIVAKHVDRGKGPA